MTQIMIGAEEWSMDEASEGQNVIRGPVFAATDVQEGARACAEKRAPLWTGR